MEERLCKRNKITSDSFRKSFKREFSAGGVVFKKDRGEVLWLVTKSAPSSFYLKGFWRLPKGWLDDEARGENPGPLARGESKASEEEIKKTALKEVKEEGGVEARILKKIGSFRWFMGKDALKFVTFYLMEFEKETHGGFSSETEEVMWLDYIRAREKLTHQREKEVLDKAARIIFNKD